MTFTRFFVLCRKFINAWGHRPRNALQWYRTCNFVLGHNPRMGGTFLAWGAQAVIWGARPRNAPRGTGPTPLTRYTLRRNTASIMKDMICHWLFFIQT